MKPLLLVIVVVLSVAGCARAAAPDVPPETTSAADERTVVAWENYADLKQIVDEDQVAGNCDGLQAAFDVQANRTDVGHAEVLKYIDEALKLADCY